MKKAILVILAILFASVAFAEPSVIRGPHATVQTDGSQADGSVNLMTQNAGPINFVTNSVKRMSVPSSYAGLVAPTVDGADSGILCYSGGGDCVTSRGALLDLRGEQAASSPGAATLSSSATAGDIKLYSPVGDVDIRGKDIFIYADNDANRRFTFGATADAAVSLFLGDAGTTAAQRYFIGANTADADDDTVVTISGGGSDDSARGAYLRLNGNEATGGVALASAIQLTPGTGGYVLISSGDVRLGTSGGTVALQEATAGAACMGTGTCNGATAVTLTTSCATTGSRVFLTRTSLDADTTGDMHVSTAPNNTAFAVTCELNDTATFNWIIFHEAP